MVQDGKRTEMELAESPSACELYDYHVDQPEKSNLVDDRNTRKWRKSYIHFGHMCDILKKQLTFNHYE